MIGPRILGNAFLALSAVSVSSAQTQTYTGTNITGTMVLQSTTNAQQAPILSSFLNKVASFTRASSLAATVDVPESPKTIQRLTAPQAPMMRLAAASVSSITTPVQTLPVVPSTPAYSFNGLTHYDQRMANGGNQFSVEPPNASIAVGNGYVLEGVNNAIQVYTGVGSPLLTKVISSNELFGVSPAINRTTGVNGVFPTDMRVFFDGGINRWFVLQRAQDFDASGTGLNSSRIYLAVSKSSDPTGLYNIYMMETTNASNAGCPCVADYPQIGADEYGFYISVNEFTTTTMNFVDSVIFAIGKASLAANAPTPTVAKFILPFSSGYEFAVQPATTPAGASNFLASGGVEYFVSTVASFSAGSNVAVWAMSNTSSLAGAKPAVSLTRTIIPTVFYTSPDAATQREGYRPYGSGLTPAGALPLIDGGDTRVQALYYSGGRLHLTFATKVTPSTGASVVGAAYLQLSPTLRGTTLNASVVKQSLYGVANHHILRPAIGVDSQGRGAIAATLVGPDWYPSAAFIPIDAQSNASMIRVAAAGAMPEDGFTGYTPGSKAQTIARWGDYCSSAVASDGSVWMVAQYIGSSARTAYANWGTFIMSTKL